MPGPDMRGYALADVALTSFDRQVEVECRVQHPDRYRLLQAVSARQARRPSWRTIHAPSTLSAISSATVGQAPIR